jgi:hypothetical protein
MWLLSIKKSDKPEKKMKATFCKCKIKDDCKGTNHKTVHFGLKGSQTYLDHKDKDKREAYLARHKANENWNDPDTAGALSRWILWGPYTSLSKNINYFKNKFKL